MLNGHEKLSEPKDYVLMSWEGLAVITVWVYVISDLKHAMWL